MIKRLTRLLRRRDPAAELQFYLDAETEDNIARGMAPEDARFAARRKLGNLTRIHEDIHNMNRSAAFFESLAQDISFAFRTLRKNPAFALTAALTLAIGIGGHAAIFSIVRSILLAPLDYREPGRLVYFTTGNPSRNEHDQSFSPAVFEHLKAGARSLQSLGAYGRPENMTLSSHGDPELLKGARVSADFLDVLGVRPATGRGFLASEDVPGGPSVAMISASLWARRFGRDPRIAGATAVLDSVPHVIVGVLPEGFEFPYAGVDIWVPRPNEWSLLPSRYWRNAALLTGFARLAPGATLSQASAELAGLTRQYAAAHRSPSNSDPGFTMRVVPLHDRLVASVRLMLWLIFGAAGFVLLIACANLAGLLLSRIAARSREFAVRAALGAGRGRLIRQMLAESLVMTISGGFIGIFIARWILSAVRKAGALGLTGAVNSPVLPGAKTLELDAMTLAFTIVLAAATAVLCGWLPALHASSSSVDLAGSLRAAGRSVASAATEKRRWWRFGWSARDLLVAGQIALSIILLIGAGLLLQSFARVRNVDPGIDVAQVLTAKIVLPLASYDTDAKRNAFFDGLLQRVSASPGVRSAALVKSLPTTAWIRTNIEVEGKPPLDSSDPNAFAVVQTITPDYFRTLGIRMAQGREFTERDNQPDAPLMIIVNETLARRLWRGDPAGFNNPLGAHIKEGFDRGTFELVGIAKDIHEGGLAANPVPEFYIPAAVHPPQTAFLIVKTAAANPLQLAGAIREHVRAVDPSQSVAEIKTMEAVFEATLGQRRITLILLGSFAGVALLLALIGVYGVIAYSVAQRTQEVGIRRALGAQPADILRLVLRHGLLLSIVGGIAGIAGALALTRLLQGMLFGVTVNDPATFGAVLVLFVAVALAASYIPARRAGRIDPMTALRME